jgi:signal transduction histidine kinase
MVGWGSVRVRVALAAAGFFALALTAASFALVRTVHDHLADEIARTNRDQLDLVARQLQRGAAPQDVRLPGAMGPLALRAVGPGGRPVPDFAVDGATTLPPDAPLVRAQRTIETARGTITLVAERSLSEVDSTVDSITRALVVGVPALVLLVAALTWWIAGRALRPVEMIRAEAAAITASTMDRRVPEPRSDDEVGRLARTMNSMLGRLESAATRQRQFVSDASHELRSPITAIRAQLEVALRRPDTADWPLVARRVLAEDDRLAGTVTDLLSLARSDEHHPVEATDVDLDEVVLEEVERTRAVPIDVSAVSAGRVRGDRAQLLRVVRNLVDNAARHARSAVAVTVTTTVATRRVTLVVDDDGPGIPVSDRDRVFERFTRLDEGRARDAGGVGLGLAMTQAVVHRLGGVVHVEDAPMGGARLVVELPAV